MAEATERLTTDEKDEDESKHRGTIMITLAGPGRYVRVVTQGKALPDIEAEVFRAAGDGARVLVGTADGLSGLGNGSESRNAAIAEWAEGLSVKHGLDWRRVGRDVLFTSVK